MTLSTTESNQQFVGNNVITVFAVTYKVLAESDLEVYLDGVIQPSGFTIVLNVDQDSSPGADITFAVAPLTDVAINIVRNVPLVQLTDYQPFDAFPATAHETALDKLTMQVQQIQELLERSPVPPPDVTPGEDLLVQGNVIVEGDISGLQAPTLDPHVTRKDYVDDADAATLTQALADYRLDAALTGMVADFAAGNVSPNWILCNGGSVSRAVYPKLFAFLGVTYGNFDGNTFNVPDYRGKFRRSVSFGVGADPDRNFRSDRGDGTTGDVVGTQQSSEFEEHVHAIKNDLDGAPGASTTSADESGGAAEQDTESAGGNETRPINVYVETYIHI